MATILVTGASRGIGYETVLQLAADPSNRILAVSRNMERLNALREEALRRNPQSQVFVAALDLEENMPDELPEWIEHRLGGLDILIHNAGLLIHKPFAELQREDWLRLFNANVFGVAALTQAVLPWLQKSSRAHVVHISSMGGFQGSAKFPGLSAYSASKAALACLTECLAEEWKDSGIAVNCLAIGAVQTEMLQEAFPGYQAPLSSQDMGAYVAGFALEGRRLYNGKILPVSVSTP